MSSDVYVIPDADRIAAARWAARYLLLPALRAADRSQRRRHMEGAGGGIHSSGRRWQEAGARLRESRRHVSPSGYIEE